MTWATCRRSRTWPRPSASIRRRASSNRRPPRRCCRSRSRRRSQPLRGLLQDAQLLRGELTPCPWLEAAITQRANADADQLAYRMADGFQHTPHLAVASLANRDRDDAITIGSSLVQERHIGGKRPTAVERNTL